MNVHGEAITQKLRSKLQPENQRYAFINVTDLDEIKSPVRRSQIRRHAKNSTISKNKKRPNRIVFHLLEPSSEPALEEHVPTAGHFDAARASTPLPSWRLLSPIGHGRGLEPLTAFPEMMSARDKHILSYGMHNAGFKRIQLIDPSLH